MEEELQDAAAAEEVANNDKGEVRVTVLAPIAIRDCARHSDPMCSTTDREAAPTSCVLRGKKCVSMSELRWAKTSPASSETSRG